MAPVHPHHHVIVDKNTIQSTGDCRYNGDRHEGGERFGNQAGAETFSTKLERLNEKELGRDVRGDELLAYLLMLLDDNGRRALQEATMSQEDLIDRDYLEYCARHEKISKDEYYGKLRRGELVAESGNVETQEVRG